MISTLIAAVAVVVYFHIGLVAWRLAESHNINGDTRLLIYGWLPVLLIVAAGAWSLVAVVDDTADVLRDDDRAQTGPTPIWIPGLLTALVIAGMVLREVGLL
jgi:hypothetical protein